MDMQHAVVSNNRFDLSGWASGFPASIHERANERSQDRQARRTALFDERRKLAAAATEKYRTMLTSYLGGADQYYAFRHMLCAKRGQYREGLIRSGNARAALTAAFRDEIDAIIGYNGKDPEKIKEIARIAFASVPLDFPPDPPVGEPGTKVFPHGPGEPTPPTPSDATVLTQFGSCGNSHKLIYPKDGYCGFKDLSDCSQNILGSAISMGTGDAGDADNFTAEVDCWLEVYTMAPTAGQLRIDVEAYGLDGINHLHTHDEVGYSDSSTNKAASLFVHVMSLTNAANVDELLCYNPFWDFSYQTAIDHDIYDNIVYPRPLPSATAQSGITPYILGQNKVMPFVTNGALHNSPIAVRVGLRRQESIFTNDVSIQSDTDGRIQIASISLSHFP